ncbi:unnamed protein product [Calypogeia fissa]
MAPAESVDPAEVANSSKTATEEDKKKGTEKKSERGEAGAAGGEKIEDKEEEGLKGGELLFCGCASWENVGRKAVNASDNINLVAPTRLSTLLNIDIAFVASGSASAHCVALDVNGRCYTWGRNEKGQLGHGDFLQRNTPTLVTALTRHMVLKAGAGRSHTVVVTEDGSSLAFGWNKHGQLGSGSLKEECEKLPVKSLVTEAKHVVCGAEFTMWLTSVAGATILSAGCPQYGQLGHGTDNEYNSKEGSVKLVYEPQPRPRHIAKLAKSTVTKVACGNNHTVAVDSEGRVYTWGFGGYGRLGHKEQKDEWVPRAVDVFHQTNLLPPSAIIAAGASYSACTAGGGQLYMWGRVKATGDNWMYPKPVTDLSGWNIRSMDCGNTSSFAAADSSCISWGTAIYGELGYGPSGPKSSAQPKLVDSLEGMHIISVACGWGHSLIIADRSKLPEKLEKLETYSGHESAQEAADEEEEEEKPAKKAPGRGRPKATTTKAAATTKASAKREAAAAPPPVPATAAAKKSKAKPAAKKRK